MFRAIEKSRVSEDAVQQIVDLIRAGEFSPGDRLPSERQLAAQLQVSRTSIREALRKLETIGLLEIRQGLGIFVKDPASNRVQAALIPHLLTDQETLQKLFELREMIEVEAAGRAAQRANAGQIAAMRHWLEAMETCFARDDLSGMVTADVEFHRQIIVATNNNILVDLLDSIADLLREMRRASLSIRESLPDTIAGHRAILVAIESRDSKAAREAMYDHLISVRAKVDTFGPRGDALASV